MPLTPQQLEMLSDAIGNLFDFDALRFLLFKCSGDNLIDEIASRLEPAKKIAFECLRQVERDGTTIAFLAFAIDMRKQSQPFRDLVHQTVPAVAEARPTTKEAVNAIVAALFKIQALLVDFESVLGSAFLDWLYRSSQPPLGPILPCVTSGLPGP